MPDTMIAVPASCLMVITSLKNSNPAANSANVSNPAITTRIFPNGLLDDMLLIQNKFPIKNSIPATIADNSCGIMIGLLNIVEFVDRLNNRNNAAVIPIDRLNMIATEV